MNFLCNGYNVCGSQREKKNRCVRDSVFFTDSKRAGQGKRSLLGSQSLFMGVLSDDFATVDLREDYANLSLPKEAKFKR